MVTPPISIMPPLPHLQPVLAPPLPLPPPATRHPHMLIGLVCLGLNTMEEPHPKPLPCVLSPVLPTSPTTSSLISRIAAATCFHRMYDREVCVLLCSCATFGCVSSLIPVIPNATSSIPRSTTRQHTRL
jgi:hypothetical protein